MVRVGSFNLVALAAALVSSLHQVVRPAKARQRGELLPFYGNFT